MKTENIPLVDIDVGRMELIKETFQWHGDQDHSRWVFRDRQKTGKTYYKIWNPSYVRRDNLLKAIDAGFVDNQTTPALSGIIFHQGICRGYALEQCKRDLKLDLSESFYRLIKEKTRKTGMFHIQFSPCHVLKYKGKSNLIDLEGIFPISDLERMPELCCRFDYEDYEEFVLGLYREKFPERTFSGFPGIGQGKFRKIHPFLRIVQSVLLSIRGFFPLVQGNHIHRILR